ncbi:MAG: ABC transporter permease [bacterium]|nr:ABC transporter permease [bacterium]
MAVAAQDPRMVEDSHVTSENTTWAAVRKFIITKPLGAIGGAVIVLLIFTAIFAPALAPYDVYELDQSLQFGAPNLSHWFGSDEFGRDLLSRIILGARIAMLIGFSASFLGATTGAFIGVVSAYTGGRTDLYVQRVMDVILAFPLLILALAIISVLGRSVPNLILAIAVPLVPRTARIVRSSALAAKEHVYVEAARAVGSSHSRIMMRHIVPNILAPYLIVLTATLGSAILTEASLSFLGLGTAEPTPSWGLMLSGGAPLYAEKAPWVAIFPGLAISTAVFGFNLFGDSLRDALDPRLRHRS